MIELLIILIFIYLLNTNYNNKGIILLLMISYVINRCIFKFKKINIFENFTDRMRFIPCSDNTNDILMNNNYQIEIIKDVEKKNDLLHKLFVDDVDNMFKFPNCSIQDDYKFDKSYTAFFDRKIFARDHFEQLQNDRDNKDKDYLLFNDPNIYRQPNDLETKMLSDYDDEFKKDFENYLEYNHDVHHSFNRGLIYTTCGDIDNKGNKYNCPYPYGFNYENRDVLCTKNNKYCENICCKSL